MTGPDPPFAESDIAAWLDRQGLAPGEPIGWEQLAGGRSNVMFRLRRGPLKMVLRRPARVAIANADAGMLREFRVLEALQGSQVPHPRPLAVCRDRDLIGCVFYVMEEVEGVTPTSLPESLGPAEQARRDVTMAVTDALAALHDVDWQARGLHDFGRPEGFHERQVDRWTRQYEEYRGRDIAEVAAAGEWLAAHLPRSWAPTIMHGDYHMLNVLIAQDPPATVTAICDWETATIGDPLLDLAGFVEVWCDAYAHNGWPTRQEITDRYASRRGLGSIPDLRYYQVLYNFRLGILLEGVYQRSRADQSATADTMAGDRALHNLRRAVELIE